MGVPEVIDVRNSVMDMLEKNNKRVLRMVRNWLIAGIFVVSCIASASLWGVWLIRHTQEQHSPTFTCQTHALNGLLKDVPLAFAGDKNPKDYAKIEKKC